MKIEKVNDNQIRCTLTREDLADRQLKLSELAYGTEKAKSLFREMIQQASYEFGFDAEDIPLMIEAIPLSADTIILIVTKVEYPDELDTRFSKFSEYDEADYENFDGDDGSYVTAEGADDILGLFKKIQEQSARGVEDSNASSDFVPLDQVVADKAREEEVAPQPAPVDVPMDITKLFSFKKFDTLCNLSHVLCGFYDDYNTLYKDQAANTFYLVISKGGHTPEDFNKVCNILSEYGRQEKYSPAQEAFFEEHYEVLVADSALQILATL